VKLLLSEYDSVQVKVRCRFDELIWGQVEAVHLSGFNWCSKLRLSARELVISVPECARLDYGELLGGRVQLTETAHGWAEAVFNEADFGNFLTYPQVQAAAPQIDGVTFSFLPDGVVVDRPAGRVRFEGLLGCERFIVELEAAADGSPTAVLLEPLGGPPGLAEAFTSFFRTLSVDLAGAVLHFHALRLDHRTGTTGPEEVIRIRLKAEILRIPNPLRDRI